MEQTYMRPSRNEIGQTMSKTELYEFICEISCRVADDDDYEDDLLPQFEELLAFIEGGII